jgi:hypothetical protein
MRRPPTSACHACRTGSGKLFSLHWNRCVCVCVSVSVCFNVSVRVSYGQRKAILLALEQVACVLVCLSICLCVCVCVCVCVCMCKHVCLFVCPTGSGKPSYWPLDRFPDIKFSLSNFLYELFCLLLYVYYDYEFRKNYFLVIDVVRCLVIILKS